MRKTNWSEVEDAKEYPKVTPGGYNCIITSVEDVEAKEYLKLEYDITDGEFKGYYRDLYTAKSFWGASFIKSYKEKAMPFFKAMLTALENSNPKFKVADFGDDPSKLRGLKVGLVLGEEEYKAKDGTIKTRLYVAEVRSIDIIKKNDFEVPNKKMLSQSDVQAQPVIKKEDFDTDDDDLPY